MRSVSIDRPWSTYIAEVANQSNFNVDLPATPWRRCGSMLKARSWGEVRDFTLAGATSMSAQMGLQFVGVESDTPVTTVFGPSFTANGWSAPGGGGYTDVTPNASQYLLARGIWRLTLTLASGTARPFLRAAGTIEVLTQ